MFWSILGQQNVEKRIEFFFLRINLFREYISGERSKEMHVQIGHKNNENILRHVELKHLGASNSKKSSKTVLLQSNKRPIRHFDLSSSPYFMVNSTLHI